MYVRSFARVFVITFAGASSPSPYFVTGPCLFPFFFDVVMRADGSFSRNLAMCAACFAFRGSRDVTM